MVTTFNNDESSKHTKRKFASELKAYRDSQKAVFREEVQNKTNEVYNENFESHLINYRYLKRMKWWCWLLVLGGIVAGVGISFLVGYLTLNSSKMPHWQGTAWVALIITLLLILTILVLGYIRSKWALDFWNDRVKRYQKTYEDNEAKLLLIRKMVILITIGMLIMAIVTSILFF